MKFDVYCDESHPDLLSSKAKKDKFMVLGSMWFEEKRRELFKSEIHDLRNKHKIGGEFKWNKVSPSRVAFYVDLVNWFFDKKDDLRFRCIVVQADKVNLVEYHENDQELGFYKFYYQMLHHWILDFNEYSVFCDYKSNRYSDRLNVLKRCLQHSNLSAKVLNVQSVRSEESVLIQIVDLFTGIVAARFNEETKSEAKKEILLATERKIGKRILPTSCNEQKFNVFKIDLKGGW